MLIRRIKQGASVHIGSIALEGAVVLGRLLAHLRDPAEIPTLLGAFQEAYKPCAQQINVVEVANRLSRGVPPGPMREFRNQVMQGLMAARHEPWRDDEYSRQWWINYAIWDYDAWDVADDWWTSWMNLKRQSLGSRDRDEDLSTPTEDTSGVGRLFIPVVVHVGSS